MHALTEKKIRAEATGEQVFRRGQEYYRRNRVRYFDFDEDILCASAVVTGNDLYDVEVCFAPGGEIVSMYCDCPAFAQFDGACKHVVALLEMCRHRWAGPQKQQGNRRDMEQEWADTLLEYFDQHTGRQEKRALRLEVTLALKHDQYSREINPFLSLKLGEDKLYVVRNIRHLLQAIEREEKLVFGKKFTFYPDVHTFRPEDQPVIDILNELYAVEQNARDYYYGRGNLFKGKHVYLPGPTLKRLLRVLPPGEFHVQIFDYEYNNAEVLEQDMPLQFTLDRDQENNGLVLQWDRTGLVPMIYMYGYVFSQDKIYKISRRQEDCFIPLVNAFNQLPEGIRFSREQQDRFAARVLPEIRHTARVDFSPAVQEMFYATGLNTAIYLDREEDTVTARVNFKYGETSINPFAAGPGPDTGDKILLRDTEQERKILNLLEKAEFHTLNGKLYLEEEAKIYTFVYHILPEIQEQAEVYYSDRFRNLRVRQPGKFSGGISLNQENAMLEFSFQLDGIDPAELGEVFNSLREKKKYHRLKDGSFLPLEEAGPGLQQAAGLVDELDIPEQQLEQGKVELPGNRALQVDSWARESGLELQRNEAFEQLVRDIKAPQAKEFNIPEVFRNVMRSYQETGFKWLKVLAGYGFGGILADDMGLGKTLQALAFIVSGREEGQLPALVVAPTSMVYSWQDEARKFAPGLKVTVVSGTPGERQKQLQEAQDAGLVVTSYALLRRDIELYEEFSFSCCFLDEAQHIKNPGSRGAKAAKKIRARARFALTGTPLENNLTELWSIFDFIMPGYLLPRREFTHQYERPIVKEQDQAVLQKLQKQIAPFVLRRMKKDVLQELPPKLESKIPAELTAEQKKIYLTYFQEAKGEIEEALASRGREKSQIKILAALTRLRQICCHPATFLENYRGDSGKLQCLKEIIPDTIESGHRVLLFSQFTSMLEIIRQHLDRAGISYFYLDGATKAEKRGAMVHAFNDGERRVFLISLKAGGTGLNLTGADTVIHYDPWWNPAVEEQATDRAYRIGQENTVQVINLVTRGTIEEKIYELQQKKKDMFNSVLQPGETMLNKMSEQEIRELFQ